jgi:hypothetical protein
LPAKLTIGGANIVGGADDVSLQEPTDRTSAGIGSLGTTTMLRQGAALRTATQLRLG